MYIDPNTGGMLFQILVVLLGILSGVILFFSGRIRKAFAKLRRKMRERSMSESEKSVSDDEVQPPTS
jgi:hypothetical protein